MAVKKKVPGGPSNGGTYTTLAQATHPSPVNQWLAVSVSIQTLPDQAVLLTLSLGGHLVLTATDAGSGGAPILAAERVGLRGDNTDFSFRDFRATPNPLVSPQ